MSLNPFRWTRSGSQKRSEGGGPSSPSSSAGASAGQGHVHNSSTSSGSSLGFGTAPPGSLAAGSSSASSNASTATGGYGAGAALPGSFFPTYTLATGSPGYEAQAQAQAQAQGGVDGSPSYEPGRLLGLVGGSSSGGGAAAAAAGGSINSGGAGMAFSPSPGASANASAAAAAGLDVGMGLGSSGRAGSTSPGTPSRNGSGSGSGKKLNGKSKGLSFGSVVSVAKGNKGKSAAPAYSYGALPGAGVVPAYSAGPGITISTVGGMNLHDEAYSGAQAAAANAIASQQALNAKLELPPAARCVAQQSASVRVD